MNYKNWLKLIQINDSVLIGLHRLNFKFNWINFTKIKLFPKIKIINSLILNKWNKYIGIHTQEKDVETKHTNSRILTHQTIQNFNNRVLIKKNINSIFHIYWFIVEIYKVSF